MLMVWYPGCSTCKKAKAFAESRGAALTLRDVKQEPPTAEELAAWQAKSGLPLKKFFNTSGQVYRSMGLSAVLPAMPEAEQLKLLAGDGMLVKRPILVGDDFVLVGFRQAEWEEKIG